MYNLYFNSAQSPTVGSLASQCFTRVALRNVAGVVIGWHCLLTLAQYNYHRTRNGKPFNKAPTGSTKKLSYYSEKQGKTVIKDCSVHQFAGVMIDDQETRKLHVPAGVDDLDMDAPPVVP